LVDEVQAEGLTPSELDWLLTNLYREKVQEPDITVIVRSRKPQRVFVGGEVIFPGAIEWREQMTVFDAVVEAGGWDREHAEPATVLVVREIDGKRHATTVDLRKAVDQKVSTPFYVAANDIIYMPQSKISRANQWVEQNINRVFPFTPLRVQEIRGNSTVGFGL
jgi:polysaccharide export outer membrane protein